MFRPWKWERACFGRAAGLRLDKCPVSCQSLLLSLFRCIRTGMASPPVPGLSPGSSRMATFARRFCQLCQFCQGVSTWNHRSTPVAEQTIATIAARIGSGRSGQESITRARSGGGTPLAAQSGPFPGLLGTDSGTPPEGVAVSSCSKRHLRFDALSFPSWTSPVRIRSPAPLPPARHADGSPAGLHAP